MSTHLQSAPHPILDLPPQLVLEVALGTEPVDTICARYGFDEDQTDRLRGTPAFWKAVKEQEAELDKNGLSFRLRAGKITEDMMGRLWTQSKTDAVPFTAKLDFAKFTAKLADLEPKGNQVLPGAGFSITFNLGDGAPASIDITQSTPLQDPREQGAIPTYPLQARGSGEAATYTPFDTLPALNADLEYAES